MPTGTTADSINNRILGIRDSYFLIIAYLVFYILPLGLRPLGIPDEMRYAEIPREMLSSGDWIVPTLNNLFYFEKPVLGYWLNALSIAAFGENPFAVRFPAALMAGLSTLLIFGFMKKHVDRRSAVIACVVQLSTLEIFFVGTYAVLDSLLAFTLCGVFVFYYQANMAQTRTSRYANLAITGVFCGLAFLSKGFLAFALPVIVIGAFLLYQRRFADLFFHIWIPLLVTVLVAAPWAILVHLKAPDFWHYFFWVEHIKRFSGNNAQHAAPIWTYVAAFPLLGFPWTLIMLNGIRNIKSQMRQQPLLVYLMIWFILPILFFSIAKGKLLTYLLPVFPAFSMLTAMSLSAGMSNMKKIRWRGETVGFTFILVLVCSLVVLQASANEHALFAGNEQWQFAFFVACLLAGGLLLWRSMSYSHPTTRSLYIAATVLPLFLYWASFIGLPREVSNRKTPQMFISTQAKFIANDAILISDDAMVHSVTWTLKRDDVYLLNTGELKYGLSYDSDKERNLEQISLRDFVAKFPQHKEFAIFYLGKKQHHRLPELPASMTRLRESHVGRFNFIYLKNS